MAGYYRFPTIFQNTIVFVAEDDLWSISVDEGVGNGGVVNGGVAHRLTSNVGEVTSPHFSPDGQWLAFVGREEGTNEVYLMEAQGGPARRLTFLGAQCRVSGWTPDGLSIIFSSSYGQPAGHDHRLYTIRADSKNGEVTALPYGEARSLSFGSQGGIVLGRNTNDPARWKRYRGGSAGQLWIDRTGDGVFERFLSEMRGNLAAPMWIATPANAAPKRRRKASANADGVASLTQGRIYFVSDHEGVGNLYSCQPDGSDIRRHSDHEDFYTRNPSTDGLRIVYHAGADLYLYDIASDRSQRIEISYRSPQVQRNRKFVDAGRYLDSVQIHPSGQALAVTSRGKLFSFFNHEGPVLQLGERDGVRYRLPEWFNDGRRMVVISDEQGEESLEIRVGNPTEAAQRLNGLDLGRVVSMKMSPTEDKIAISNHRHELMVVDLSNLEANKAGNGDSEQQRVTVVDRSLHRPIAGFNWSPDGRWIAYGFANTMQTTEIRLYRLPNGDKEAGLDHPNPVAITQPILQDVQPAFDPEGRFLYFLSYREFNPVYDGLHFDIGFPWGMRPYLLLLQSDANNPFIPRPDLERDDRESPREEPPIPAGGDGNEEPEDKEEEDKEKSPAEPTGTGESDDTDETDENGEATPSSENTEAVETLSPAASSAEPAKPEAAKQNGAKNGKQPKPIRIDLDGIQHRVIAFPVPDGRYYQIMGIAGKALFSAFEIYGQLPSHDSDDYGHRYEGTLRSYNFKEYKFETLVDGINNFQLSRNGKKLLYKSGRRLRIINAGEKPASDGGNSRRTGWIELHRVKVSVDPHSEWEQMFREAWRLQRDHFWTADMAQVDWRAIYERYFPLIGRVSSRSEFSDLMWEMQGELGTSHAYEYGGDYRNRPHYGQGFLGANFQWDAEAQGYRVRDIVGNTPWNVNTVSPLLSPGADIRDNDLLIAINGQRLSAEISPAQLLVNQAENEVLLTFAAREVPAASEDKPKDEKVVAENSTKSKKKRKATAKTLAASEQSELKDTTVTANAANAANTNKPPLRYAVVEALAGEAACRYRAWVETCRHLVHEATEGRIGYVHIPNMGVRGYAEFHRGYLAELTRDGLIVDVRFNGGGHVSQLLLEKLARKRIGYDLSRWGGLTPYPAESVAGPIVALTNEHAGSDGDIFSHSFKLMKLGPLVGKRTWGGVIGISPRHPLVDGTTTTQPEYSFWFEDIGWNLENHGAAPDIEVDIAPHDYAAGRDPQLERAIAEALRLLALKPVVLPRLEEIPSRALPKLPPR